ncbi:hypothetical protein N7485_004983 [Penicillium canescens]|nr:hypothetical protein N7485_005134 [Penicillium canescens]KAJ6174818.1 hypothetical protein N7485_004623 [Penicillium canescens]KAJ6174956.1 hypothetical protein N7485_004761 [Penicillium canescens]KAJ6175104.1 hypothetical protein N7485_004909 [Penicillium canescens]KAJ6175178.1 hypothetical protein N7485_004983 [Penicillium canescens]
MSSRSIHRSLSPLLSIEPSSDVSMDSDFQSSPFTGSRRSVDTPAQQPPTILRRVGPDRRKNWILYEPEHSSSFLTWWQKTEYGQVLNGDGRSKIKWSMESHYAEVWKHFDQVAGIETGIPKVISQKARHKRNGKAPEIQVLSKGPEKNMPSSSRVKLNPESLLGSTIRSEQVHHIAVRGAAAEDHCLSSSALPDR